MRVVVREGFKAYINMQPEDFHPGQKIKGDTAVLLLRTNAPVYPDDDEAVALAQELRGADVEEDQGEQQPTDPDGPPADEGQGGSTEQQPQDELDIDGPVPDVLDWVGTDPERAGLALRLEQEKAKPRTTLVSQLTKIADA